MFCAYDAERLVRKLVYHFSMHLRIRASNPNFLNKRMVVKMMPVCYCFLTIDDDLHDWVFPRQTVIKGIQDHKVTV